MPRMVGTAVPEPRLVGAWIADRTLPSGVTRPPDRVVHPTSTPMSTPGALVMFDPPSVWQGLYQAGRPNGTRTYARRMQGQIAEPGPIPVSPRVISRTWCRKIGRRRFRHDARRRLHRGRRLSVCLRDGDLPGCAGQRSKTPTGEESP